MTETALELRQEPSAVMLTNQQLNFISRTEFVPAAFRGNLPAILACVATGRALGLADVVALRSIHIIDGKATFSAELMVSLVRAHGHSITFKASGDSCTVMGRRADNGDEGEFTWTLDMAERAGLMKKSNWVKYPESMLFARAASQLCRMLFADCLAGASYSPEELGSEEFTADELMDEPSWSPLEVELLQLADVLDAREKVEEAIDHHRDADGEAYEDWLQSQIVNAQAAVEAREAEAA